MKVGRTFLSARLNSWHGNGDGKKARPACFRTVVPWKAKGRRRLRAKVFTACLALRTIEKTGDSSTSLRMTCFAISVRETRRSYLRPTCHAAERFEKVGRTFLSARFNSWHGNGDGKKARPADSSQECARRSVSPHCHAEEALSAVPCTGRRQAVEGSSAASIHPCGTCTCTDRKGGTSGTAPLPVSGRGRGRGRHADEAKGLTTSPRKSVYRVFGVKDNREDGRFFDFAQNDMLCNQRPRDTSIIPAPNLSCCGNV